MSPAELHPAEHRGYRELYAAARGLERHWGSLAEHFDQADATPLADGAAAARRVLDELRETTERYDLYGSPAARNVGSAFAAVRRLRDPFLERNQGLRLAVLDGQHVATLTAYLGTLAAVRDDEELAAACRRWERRLSRAANAVRKAAIDAGSDPDAAIAPLDTSPVGRAAQRAASLTGTFGEWIDRRAARKSEE